MRQFALNAAFALIAVAVAVGVSFLSSGRVTPVGRSIVSLAGSLGELSHGAELFRLHCAGCHAASDVRGGSMGPDLSNIGAAAGERRPGMSGPAYLLESILEPAAFVAPGGTGAMPAGFGTSMQPRELRALVTFLASQGGTPDGSEIRGLEIAPPAAPESASFVRRKDQLQAGRELFLSNGCTDCHSMFQTGSGHGELHHGHSLLGPGLSDVGTRSPDWLRESILDPSSEIRSGYQQVSIGLNGWRLTGRLIAADDSGLVVVTGGIGNARVEDIAMDRVVVIDDVPDVQPIETSSMPSYAGRFTEAELDDLVAFLRTLY